MYGITVGARSGLSRPFGAGPRPRGGDTDHFYDVPCLARFAADPARYLSASTP